MQRIHCTDIICRVIGILVFCVGVGLLVAVFSMAYKLFNSSPAQVLGISFTGNPHKDPGAATIGSQFGWLLCRIGFLLLMALAGSLVAQKGVNLYLGVAHSLPLLGGNGSRRANKTAETESAGDDHLTNL